MIDIHSHVLPFVDDGSKFLNDSLNLVEVEAKNGVEKIICTPHYKKNVYDLDVEEIKRVFEDFKKSVKEKSLSTQLFLGQEIYCTQDIYNLLKENKVLTINGSKCILIEFNYYEEQDIADYVYNLKTLGYTPVIAHVERYIYLDWDNLFDLKQLGALLQVNASSILGEEGRTIKKRVLNAIKQGLIDFVGSDIHSDRGISINRAYKTVVKVAGVNVANQLFKHNAENYFGV